MNASAWRTIGVSPFPLDPTGDARQFPALWRSENCSLVLVYAGKFHQLRNSCSWPDGRSVLAERVLDGTRHMVIEDLRGRYRLQCLEGSQGQYPGFIIATDSQLRGRAIACQAFCDPCSTLHMQLKVSRFRRHRWSMLLSILDCLDEAPAGPPNLREIAARVIYPNSSFGSATEWKTSSHRRNTQRLVREAHAMVAGGYRKLLVRY